MQEAEAMGVCLTRTLTSVLCFVAVGKLLRLQQSIYATVGSAHCSHDEPVLCNYQHTTKYIMSDSTSHFNNWSIVVIVMMKYQVSCFLDARYNYVRGYQKVIKVTKR